MLKLIDTMKTAKKGAIRTEKETFEFDMSKIGNESDLNELFMQITDAEYLDVWGSNGYRGSFSSDLIEGYNFSHFKFAFVFWDYLDFMYDDKNGEFSKGVMKEYQRKYNFNESLVEIVFYLLTLGDLTSFAFAPIYLNYNHYLKHLYELGFNYMHVSPKCNLSTRNGEIVIFLEETLNEYAKEKQDYTLIEGKMDALIAILRSMTHLQEDRFFNRIKCKVVIRLNGKTRSINFYYESPHYILNYLLSMYGEQVIIDRVEDLSIYYN